MNKTTQSLLLAAMLTASGFAAAQNPAVPATRAEVKSEATTGERKLGTGETAKPATGTPIQGTTAGTTPAPTRAEVKSEAGTAERRAGTGELIKPNTSGTMQGNTSGVTRAEVKAEAGNTPRVLGTGEVAKSNTTSTTSAERKRMRDERRALAKAKRDAKMKMSSTTPAAPVTDKAP